MVEYPPAVIKHIDDLVDIKLISEYGSAESIIKNVYIPAVMGKLMGIPVLSDQAIYDILSMIDEYMESVTAKGEEHEERRD